MTLRLSQVAIALGVALAISGGVLAADSTTATQTYAPPTNPSGKIERTFGSFAGSPENASSLVAGLRNSSQVTLTQPPATPRGQPTVVTFQPPTRPMGWGNVRNSLALAQTQLAGYGITQPTAQQLAASLNGGPITVTRPDGITQTVQLQGALQMRASGMGWGEIAHAYGTKLGPVISGLKPNGSVTAAGVAATGYSTAAGVSTAAQAGAKVHGRGIVSATGNSSGSSAAARAGTGISTAAGGPAMGGVHGQGKGIATAAGNKGSGVVTAAGGGTSGVVTAAGGVPGGGAGAASMSAHGSGIVNAGGSVGRSGQGLAKGHYK